MVGSLQTDCIKLLGVHIDCNTNFSGHISELCKKRSQKESRDPNAPAQSCSLLSYESSILPYLTYCQLV